MAGPDDNPAAPAPGAAQPVGSPEPPPAPAATPSPGSEAALAEPPRLFTLRLVRVTSFIFLTSRSVKAMSGMIEDLNAFYRKVLILNLLVGWWGFPFGFVWTPMALSSNAKARRKLRELESGGHAPAGWFPDPTGRHGARYWDGQAWTDRVSDIGTDDLATATSPEEQAAPGPLPQAPPEGAPGTSPEPQPEQAPTASSS